MVDAWELYPFPTLAGGVFTDGSIFDVHRDCRSCPTRDCADDDVQEFGEPKICRYGLTYARIDDDRVTAGMVTSDLPNATPKARSRLRSERVLLVDSSRIRRSVKKVRELGPGVVESFEANRALALEALKSDPVIQRAVAEQLRADADADLSQSHDFMQMVKRVKGYAESLLDQRRPGISPEKAAEDPELRDEGAIFFATELMVFKMDSLQYVNEINRASGNEGTFGIHPLILKYKRIYEWTARQKGVKIQQGLTQRLAHYNGHAIGTLVQALLDNMVKYAPPRADAFIDFIERPSSVVIQFRSPGPRIEEDEVDRIFLMKGRAKAAREAESSGQGIGLAAAKQISDMLRLNISCAQEPDQHYRFPGFYMTTFTFELATTG